MRSGAFREPPEGYQRAGGATVRGNRRLSLLLNVLAVPWLVGCLIGYGLLAAALRRPGSAWSGGLSLTPLAALGGLAVLGAGLFAVMILHELAHGLAFWLFAGARPRFGTHGWYGYASAPGWFLSRARSLAVLLAPLVSFTLAGLPLLALGDPVVATTTLLVLIVNAGAALGDLYLCLCVLRLPRGAVVEDRPDGVVWYLPEP